MDDQEFRAQLERRIAGLRAMAAKLDHEIREADEARAQVRRRLASAERMYELEFGGTLDDAAVLEMLPVREEPAAGPMTGLGWAEAVVRVLSGEGRAMHVREIWDRLQDGGFRTESRDPLRSLVAVVVRSDDFVKVRPNTYALRRARGGEEAPQA